MVVYSGTWEVSARSMARGLVDNPEECAKLIVWLASLGGDTFREELSHHLQTAVPRRSHGPIRDLALMIAGACGEAE